MKYFLRVISLPFVLAIAVIKLVYVLVVFGVNYIRFGGEVIAYSKDSKTIGDVFEYIQERYEEEKSNI